MFLSALLSLRSIVSLSVLAISVGIGAFFYLTIDENFEIERPQQSLRANSGPLGKEVSFDDVNQIINSARQAWSIIDKNRAVSDIQTSYGNVLPAHITNPFDLQSWASPPASHSYTVNIYNRLKQRVVQFTFSLQFTHGGSLDGKGAYLDRVTIVPSRISVAWGFVFNANVKVTSVQNIGTREDPIAAAYIELHYRLSGLNVVERTETFHVAGNGRYVYLNA